MPVSEKRPAFFMLMFRIPGLYAYLLAKMI